MEQNVENKFLSVENQGFAVSRPDSDISGVDSNQLNNVDEGIEMLFEECRSEEDGKISVKKFLEELNKFGIRENDPRLSNMMGMLNMLKPNSVSSVDVLKLDTQVFRNVISENFVLINKIIYNSFIIPNFDIFSKVINDIYEECKENCTGKTADYIPQLAVFGSEHWGVSICTIDGQRLSLGDSETPFTLQAISQALTYAWCVNEHGEDQVHKLQGREPSGRNFDEICLDHHGKPHNPLLNSGGILSVAMVLQSNAKKSNFDLASNYDLLYQFIKGMAGDDYLGFNNSAYLSERQCCDRNRALGHFLAENGCLPKGADVKKIIELYSQLCSLEMTCESLAVVASTLANGGVCPISGERCLTPEAVTNVRALMYSCGMYNYSGQFAFDVGVPAKSGISGATMVIIPNVMGIALWSPNLDKLNNSVRGSMFCVELLKTYAFHRFDNVGGNQYDEEKLIKIDPTYQKSQTAGELQTQLLLAAANDDKLAMQRYWMKDIDMNISDWDSRTAMHVAASEGNYITCKFLLEVCKVNPSPRDRWGSTPLQEAARIGNHKIVSLIKKVMNEHPERVVIANTELQLDEDSEEELERIVEGEVFEPQSAHVRDNSGMNEDDDNLLAGTPRTRATSASYENNSLNRMAGMLAPSEVLTNAQPIVNFTRRNSVSNLNPSGLQQALLVRNRQTPTASPSRSPAAPRTPRLERNGSQSDRQSPSLVVNIETPSLVVNVECPSD